MYTSQASSAWLYLELPGSISLLNKSIQACYESCPSFSLHIGHYLLQVLWWACPLDHMQSIHHCLPYHHQYIEHVFQALCRGGTFERSLVLFVKRNLEIVLMIIREVVTMPSKARTLLICANYPHTGSKGLIFFLIFSQRHQETHKRQYLQKTWTKLTLRSKTKIAPSRDTYMITKSKKRILSCWFQRIR